MLVAIKEPDESDDFMGLVVANTVKQLTLITIQLFHAAEIGITHAKNDG